MNKYIAMFTDLFEEAVGFIINQWICISVIIGGICILATAGLIYLKVTDRLSLSWLWTLSPLWIGIIILLLAFGLACLWFVLLMRNWH